MVEQVQYKHLMTKRGLVSPALRALSRDRRVYLLTTFFAAASIGHASDLVKLPADTWVELKYTTVQPADAVEKGNWVSAGWNKIVYDPEGKRVLFYDRWYDKKHGGVTIYGNCLFAFDPASAKLTPVKIDNWKKIDVKGGGYRTVPLPENDKEPTPVSRHVYHAFDYVPELKAVFICNGANQVPLDRGERSLYSLEEQLPVCFGGSALGPS